MNTDPLYFSRKALANALVESLTAGITNAFTLFAPRRMGKTQFLLQDIVPVAESAGFNVFYFSFMDDTVRDIGDEFRRSLNAFADNTPKTGNLKKFLGGVVQFSAFGVSVSRQGEKDEQERISETIARIAAMPHKSILLLDEVQELARVKNTDGIIRSLRTGLDIHKNQVKVIFTGSSTNGLTAMFDNHKAPFFQFSHALDFPPLGKEFSDFLADIYYDRTRQLIDKSELYQIFQQMHFVPLYLRATIQDMIINPALSLQQAASVRLQQMNERVQYAAQWQQLTPLEQAIVVQLTQGKTALYSKATCQIIAQELGLEKITPSNIQTALLKLNKKEFISKNSNATWQINDPIFAEWVIKNQEMKGQE